MTFEKFPIKSALKAGVLMAFIVGATLAIRSPSVRSHLTAAALDRFLDAAGLWAPAAYVVFYAAGVCLFVPGSLLTGIGAAFFGPYLGFAYVWVGAMIGASGAFFIARTLGRDFAAGLVGNRLKRYDDAIGRNGFATVLYLRLIYFPFTPMSFGMGLTGVTFRDYFFGTALGILVGTFLFTFFIGTLREVWATGDWAQLLSFKVFLSVALFVFSFFIPKILKTVRREQP